MCQSYICYCEVFLLRISGKCSQTGFGVYDCVSKSDQKIRIQRQGLISRIGETQTGLINTLLLIILTFPPAYCGRFRQIAYFNFRKHLYQVRTIAVISNFPGFTLILPFVTQTSLFYYSQRLLQRFYQFGNFVIQNVTVHFFSNMLQIRYNSVHVNSHQTCSKSTLTSQYTIVK